MLIFAGLELAAAGRDMKVYLHTIPVCCHVRGDEKAASCRMPCQDRDAALATIGTAAGCLALKSTGWGAVVGMVISVVQKVIPRSRSF